MTVMKIRLLDDEQTSASEMTSTSPKLSVCAFAERKLESPQSEKMSDRRMPPFSSVPAEDIIVISALLKPIGQ